MAKDTTSIFCSRILKVRGMDIHGSMHLEDLYQISPTTTQNTEENKN